MLNMGMEVKKKMLRKIRKIRSNIKAVSPVVATLLLIAIAVAAAIVSYSWIMSMIKTQGSSAQTGIRLELVEFAKNGTANEWLNVTIRNVGSTTTTIETFYVTVGGNTYVQDFDAANVINVGDKREMCFGGAEMPDGFIWTTGEAYDIKVVTDNGFSVDGTFFSPAS
jgi:flagellin-like protein